MIRRLFSVEIILPNADGFSTSVKAGLLKAGWFQTSKKVGVGVIRENLEPRVTVDALEMSAGGSIRKGVREDGQYRTLRQLYVDRIAPKLCPGESVVKCNPQ